MIEQSGELMPMIEEQEYVVVPEKTVNDYVVKEYSDGEGVVEPTGEISDFELAESVHEAQKPIDDPHVVCIDERPGVEAQPVREKVSGGPVTTGFAAARIAGWSLFTDEQRASGAETQVAVVADHLVAAGEKLGGHMDNHAGEGKSNCGSADGCPLIIGRMGKYGRNEQFVEQMQDALGDNFNPAVWDEMVTNAQREAQGTDFQTWSGMIIIDAIRQRDGVVEVLNGDNTRPDQDPENLRHNHWAEGVYISSEEGKSNDRDHVKIPFFQVDAPAIIRICQKMATSEAEFDKLLHAAVGYQFATRFKLTKNQRNLY